jgi:hypothetical protein
VTKTVPVRKEKAVLESEPITEGNVDAATDGPVISDEEHEVVLNEEEVVGALRAYMAEQEQDPLLRLHLRDRAMARRQQRWLKRSRR